MYTTTVYAHTCIFVEIYRLHTELMKYSIVKIEKSWPKSCLLRYESFIPPNSK